MQRAAQSQRIWVRGTAQLCSTKVAQECKQYFHLLREFTCPCCSAHSAKNNTSSLSFVEISGREYVTSAFLFYADYHESTVVQEAPAARGLSGESEVSYEIAGDADKAKCVGL